MPNHNRDWRSRYFLLVGIPSAVLSLLFTFSILALIVIFIAGRWVDLNALHLPGLLSTLWGSFLSDPGTWSAVATAGFSLFFGRIQVMFRAPRRRDNVFIKSLSVKYGWGRKKSVILYSALSVPYKLWATGLLATWAGFVLAKWLLGVVYAYAAVPVVLTAVYAWLQQPPGATLYALRQMFLFGTADKQEKVRNREALLSTIGTEPQLFGSFGPRLRFSERFYLRGIPLLVGGSLSLFSVYGLLLIFGFASGPSPTAWKISFVTIGSTLAGVLIGWCGCYLSSLLVWRNSIGSLSAARAVGTGREWWYRAHKLSFTAMVGATWGPSSQLIGFLMVWLLGGRSQNLDQGNYVFWGHLAGEVLSVLMVVIGMAKQMSHHPKQGNTNQ